jgi:predicted DNA-binding protein
MGRTLRTQVALYLDDVHIELLDKLARKSGRTKQDLLREAVATLLLEYDQMFKLLKRKTRRKADPDSAPAA